MDGLSQVRTVLERTERPVILTEFGQGCQPTHGAAERCPGTLNGTTMGYDEAILMIAEKHGVSWLPWAWRPMASGPNTKTCQDVNGGAQPAGLSLAHPTDGAGADFADLWHRFAPSPSPGPSPGPSPAPPPPPPSGCPGGSVGACMGLCPSTPLAAFQACVDDCARRCT